MVNLIIISYYYTPARFPASIRIEEWANNLHKYGIYPIIITRSWSNEAKNFVEISTKIEEKRKVIKSNSSKIIYLPHKRTVRDFWISKFGLDKFILIRKLLSLFQGIYEYFFFIKDYKFFFNEAISQINQIDKGEKALLISGSPFNQFKIGYHLKKKYPEMMLINDYRDEWTTHPYYKRKGILKLLDKYFEKKWLTLSNQIICVEPVAQNNLINIHNISCKIIANGYKELDQNNSKVTIPFEKDFFHIIFSGTFYEDYNTEEIKKTLKICKLKYNISIHLIFLGSCPENKLKAIIKKEFFSVVEKLSILERVPFDKAINYMSNSDMLLILTFKKKNLSIPSSKLYQYLILKKPILLIPSDYSIIETILKKTAVGIVENTPEIMAKKLNNYYLSKERKQDFKLKINDQEIKKFSAEEQTSKLSQLILDFYQKK